MKATKQETIEQASEYHAHNYFDMHETNNYKALKQGFEAGAKWQQEQMYSEEEVELIANEMVNWAIDNVGNPNPQSGKKFDEVIAKFKNK